MQSCKAINPVLSLVAVRQLQVGWRIPEEAFCRKIITSRLWRHRATWRHRKHAQTIALHGHFPRGCPLESFRYLASFPRYLAPKLRQKIIRRWRHQWRNYKARIKYIRTLRVYTCRYWWSWYSVRRWRGSVWRSYGLSSWFTGSRPGWLWSTHSQMSLSTRLSTWQRRLCRYVALLTSRPTQPSIPPG